MRIIQRAGPSNNAHRWQHRASVHIGVIVFLGCTLLLGTPLLSWAHFDQPSALVEEQSWQQINQALQSWSVSSMLVSLAILEAPLLFLLFALIAMMMAHRLWRWRRAVAVGLTLALCVFILGIAVHSVHHLSDPTKAAECLVFLASQYVSGTLDQAYTVSAPMLAIAVASLSADDGPTLALHFRSDLPRAPPSSST